MHIFLVSEVTNIILNIALIPSLGIIGAAIASAFAVAMANIIISIKLYQFSKIHPLTKNYLKPIIISILVTFIIYIVAKKFLIVTFWTLFVLFVLFLLIYALLLLLTKSFDNEDVMILLEIEKRFGMNLTLIKRFLKRFM